MKKLLIISAFFAYCASMKAQNTVRDISIEDIRTKYIGIRPNLIKNKPGFPPVSRAFIGNIPVDTLIKAVQDINLGGKVDKVTGKQLSTNDYTTPEKTKLAALNQTANDYTTPEKTKLAGIYPALNDSLLKKQNKGEPIVIKTKIGDDNALSAEKLLATNWVLGAGWTGNNTIGFSKTNGIDNVLNNSFAPFPGRMYQLKIDRESDVIGGTLTVTIGSIIILSEDAGDIITEYIAIPGTNDDDNLIVSAGTDNIGNVKFSIKEVTGYNPALSIYNGAGKLNFEIRTSQDSNSTYVGLGAGRNNIVNVAYQSSVNNTVFGTNSLLSTNSSYNVVVGDSALPSILNQSFRNVIIGSKALSKANNAVNSVIIGAKAGGSGIFNRCIAIGADAMGRTMYEATGNIGIGLASLSLIQGSDNIAIGNAALTTLNTGYNNLAIGHSAGLLSTSSTGNIFMGNNSGLNNTVGNNNTIIGVQAHQASQITNNNTVVGNNSFISHTTGDNNIVVGSNTANFNSQSTSPATTASNCIYLGNNIKGTGNNGEIIIGHNVEPFNIGANPIIIGGNNTGNVVLNGTNITAKASLDLGNPLLGTSAYNSTILRTTGSAIIYGKATIGRITGNETPANVFASAVLTLNGTDGGLLLNRLTSTQINALASPPTGLTLYNTTLNLICFFNGTSWQRIASSAM